MTTALSVLEQRLSQQIGDFLEFDTTTTISTNNTITSTTLNSYDGGRDDYFNEWWVRFTEGVNYTAMIAAGLPTKRQVSDYATSGGTITIRGAAMAAEAGAVTLRLFRYDPDKYLNAFNDTSREISKVLFKPLDVMELVTGNILPNSHFRDWTATTVPDKYALSSANITCTALATAGNYRGGAKSMNALTGAAGAASYVYITSASYPPLLDIMNKTASAYVWAYPQQANDASIVIYTIKADGTTTQTLTSTTTCPAGAWTLLKLEDQAINDDIVTVQVRFAIASNSKYVYFDNARLIGANNQEYLLPLDFKNGSIDRVEIQNTGYSDKICDDLKPTGWETCYDWTILDDGTDKYLQLPSYTSSSLIRLQGSCPLSTLSAFTDTIEIDGDHLNLFIAYAKYKLFQAIKTPVSASDIGRYRDEIGKPMVYMRLLSNLRQSRPKAAMKIRGI